MCTSLGNLYLIKTQNISSLVSLPCQCHSSYPNYVCMCECVCCIHIVHKDVIITCMVLEVVFGTCYDHYFLKLHK